MIANKLLKNTTTLYNEYKEVKCIYCDDAHSLTCNSILSSRNYELILQQFYVAVRNQVFYDMGWNAVDKILAHHW